MGTQTARANVTLPAPRQHSIGAANADDLLVEAWYPRPRASVFLCWTDAEYIELFCNPGNAAVQARVKAAPGSPFSITAHQYGMTLFRIEGLYLQIDHPSRIECAWQFQSAQLEYESTVSFDMTACAGGTRLCVTESGIADAHRRQLQRHWWNALLGRMGNLLR